MGKLKGALSGKRAKSKLGFGAYGISGGKGGKVGLGFSGSKGGKIAQGMAAKLKAKGWSG